MDKILIYIPGFRTRTPRHMILAAAYYLFSVSMMLVSVALGALLLSGPFLLFNGHTSIMAYNESKNARTLIALFVSAVICGGSLIGFVADMTGRGEHIPAEMVSITNTAAPHTTPADSTVSLAETPSPSPSAPSMEKAIVLEYTKDGIHVQFADESAGEVRLAGIKIDEESISKASNFLSEILPPGSIVYIERDGEGYYVWADPPLSSDADEVRLKTLNALLVLNGYAATDNTNGTYADVLAACQEEARAACLGLWTVALETAGTATSTPAPVSISTPAPAPASSPEAVQSSTSVEEAPPGGAYYCGSKNSDVFHLPTCGSASQISPENIVIYNSREEAINQGKRPCKKCNP